MIPVPLKRDIDNLVTGNHLRDLAIYLINYVREDAGDTESVFHYALERVKNEQDCP